MSKWVWVVILAVQAHFAASFLVPLVERDQRGVLRWLWPWGVDDRGFLGRIVADQLPSAGLFIALAAAGLFILAILGVLGIWVPRGWWPGLAVAGSVLELVLMVGFFGLTKLLPIAVNLAVLYLLWTNWPTLRTG